MVFLFLARSAGLPAAAQLCGSKETDHPSERGPVCGHGRDLASRLPLGYRVLGRKVRLETGFGEGPRKPERRRLFISIIFPRRGRAR